MTHSFPARRFSDLADIAGAVGLFDGDGGAAFGAKLGADRLRVVRREAGEHALDGGEDGGGIRIGRRQGGALDDGRDRGDLDRSEEHTSELQSLMRISYAVCCWKKKNTRK